MQNCRARILGSNTRAEMVALDASLRMAKCRQLMAEGVTIFYPESCVIDSEIEIGADTVIEPFCNCAGRRGWAAIAESSPIRCDP